MSDREGYLMNMASGFFSPVFGSFSPLVLLFSKLAKMRVCWWARDNTQDVHH